MSAWASVQGGKWHRIPAPVTRENYRAEHHGSCGVSFRVFNSHDGAEAPTGWNNICRKCSKAS